MNVTLGFFTSTKGHFGRKDTYQYTFESLINQDIFSIIDEFVIHIKVSPEEDKIASEIEKWFQSKLKGKNYNILKTKGSWAHDDASHREGYTRDIYKVLSHSDPNDLFFWMEDDWIIEGDNPSDKLWESLERFEYLETLNIRINNQPLEKDVEDYAPNLFRQGPKYTQWGPTMTFQPNLSRVRDLQIIYNLILKDWERHKNIHIELINGEMAKMILPDPHFLLFDYNELKARHIGTPKEFDKWISENS